MRLAAKLALSPDLARHARDFRSEAVELINHRVDCVFQLQNFATYVDCDLLGEIASRNSCGDFSDIADLTGEVRGHRVDVVGEILPCTSDTADLRLSAELALRPDLARHTRDFRGEAVQLIDHRIDSVFQRKNLAFDVDSDLAREIALGDGGRHLGDVANLARKIGGHRVHRVGQVLPRTGYARHLGLAAKLALGSHFPRYARNLRREAVKLINHRVDGLLQLQNFSLHVDCDFPGKVAAGHGRGHRRNVADLCREVRSHRVHRIGQVLPCAGDARHHRLAAEPPISANFAGYARYF